jgi:hypothetical protein
MRNQIRARAEATERRQRLQIGGGSLLVALIWIIALWPSSGEEPASQPVPAPRASYTPWTTGPFVGTTPTTSGSSVPRVLQSTIPTAGSSADAVAPQPEGRVAPPTTTVAGTRAPAPAPTTTSTPGKKGNGNGKPPKPTNQPAPTSSEGTDLLDVFGL